MRCESTSVYSCAFTQVFMTCWNLECTKSATLNWVKVGGGKVMGQGAATEVIHVRLNQPPIFSSDLVI